MTVSNAAHADRLLELLADRATQGLLPDEQHELDALLAEHADIDDASMDWAAAALDLNFTHDLDEPLPGSLREIVVADATNWQARQQGLRVVADDDVNAARPSRVLAWVPWLVAAASVAFIIFAWPDTPVEPQTPAEVYADLRDEPRTITIPWNDPGNLGVTGEIIWNNREQAGVMRLSGLPANDPQQMQYQLWIFDDARKEFTEFDAVDGGVFNVERVGQDVFVTVDPKLEVFDPYLFAVTTEPPGGVVKHVDRDDYRIILTAPVPQDG